MPDLSSTLIDAQPIGKGRGVAGHRNVIFATQIGNAFPRNSRPDRAGSTAEALAVAVQSKPVRAGSAARDRAATLFYSTLFLVTQGAWVGFLVWVFLKIT
jgi:hypothetical protein